MRYSPQSSPFRRSGALELHNASSRGQSHGSERAATLVASSRKFEEPVMVADNLIDAFGTPLDTPAPPQSLSVQNNFTHPENNLEQPKSNGSAVLRSVNNALPHPPIDMGPDMYRKNWNIQCTGSRNYYGKTSGVEFTPTSLKTPVDRNRLKAFEKQARARGIPKENWEAYALKRLQEDAEARARRDTQARAARAKEEEIKVEIAATNFKGEASKTNGDRHRYDGVDNSHSSKLPELDAEEPSSQSQPLARVGTILQNPSHYLSDEQKAVLHQVLSTKANVFFTGAAGTGKSVLSRCIIEHLRRMYSREDGAVAVTATTGLAAVNIGGITLHSFAGVGLANGTTEQIIRRIKSRQAAVQRWTRCKVLVIDEVSMLSADLLDKLNAVAQHVRKSSAPFGGIQVVMSGDMFQLPPIEKDEWEVDESIGRRRVFCFDAFCWSQLIDRTFNLTQVFRQANPEFVRMLNELREGRVDAATEHNFKDLCRPIKIPKGLVPTQLFPLRREADAANRNALGRLGGTRYVYHSEDWIQDDHKDVVQLDNGLAPKELELKVGAQVMLIKNINAKLVNGTIGRVIGFMTNSAYGAVSSVRPTDALIDALDQDARDNAVHPVQSEPWVTTKIMGALPGRHAVKDVMVQRLVELHIKGRAEPMWPWVRFITPDGSEITTVVMPEKWSTEDAKGDEVAYRIQVPLMCAWAMSMHKSQGQTLRYLSVNLNNVFERGQAYVAISRATCTEGLQMHNFRKSKVFADPQVLSFNTGLSKVSDEEIKAAKTYFESGYEEDFGAKGRYLHHSSENVVESVKPPRQEPAQALSRILRVGGRPSQFEEAQSDTLESHEGPQRLRDQTRFPWSWIEWNDDGSTVSSRLCPLHIRERIVATGESIENILGLSEDVPLDSQGWFQQINGRAVPRDTAPPNVTKRWNAGESVDSILTFPEGLPSVVNDKENYSMEKAVLSHSPYFNPPKGHGSMSDEYPSGAPYVENPTQGGAQTLAYSDDVNFIDDRPIEDISLEETDSSGVFGTLKRLPSDASLVDSGSDHTSRRPSRIPRRGSAPLFVNDSSSPPTSQSVIEP